MISPVCLICQIIGLDVYVWFIPAGKLVVLFVFQSDNLGDRMKVKMTTG
jgi:hypothetical protein